MNNWYTKLKLFHYLESNETAAYCTGRKDRIMPPQSLRNESLKRMESAFRRSGNVYFLSTIHQMETGRSDLFLLTLITAILFWEALAGTMS